MKILTSISGAYPRVGDTHDLQSLRHSLDSFDKKKISTDELDAAFNDTIKQAISEQRKAKLDIITDGMIRWYDPVSHVLQHTAGARINGLLRFYDTNFYFRQPVIEGKLKHTPFLAQEFSNAARHGATKQTITGPFTLASLSQNNFYKTKEELVADLAKAIAAEVEALDHAGCRYIQIDEPEICQRPREFSLLKKAFARFPKRKNAQLLIYTYFGNAARVIKQLATLPVDGVGYDFTYTKPTAPLPKLKGKTFIAGIIDARNTKADEVTSAARAVEKVLAKTGADTCIVSTSTGLEYLPRENARQKLHLILEVKKCLEKN